MAIQKINLGTEPLGEGGDTYRSANTKINENFSNTTHAASRLVGLATGNVVEMTADGIAGTGWGAKSPPQVASAQELHLMRDTGIYKVISADIASTGAPSNAGDSMILLNMPYTNNYNVQLAITRNASSKMFFRGNPSKTEGVWHEVYHTGNTTKEEDTGYLVASSPVLKVQHDSFEKVHEAEQLDIDIKHIKTGVYEITGTTGLRDSDGWSLKPPKDVNGNVLCICEATEKNAVITLKTYKKKFDFETVSIVADYEQPTDIPEGATVMLRFNDLPQEHLKNLEPEEEPVVDEAVESEVEEEETSEDFE